jgi:formate hydrogenlyase subunit 3/multisubunit Na+/H+ antiporter MnhD subunit
MAFTLLGETFLLMGFVLLAAAEPNGSLQIRDVMAALPASPWRDTVLALVIIGFGMKIALVPVHGRMPLAYTAAPTPAAAVLSGAAVKAGVIGLIRFLSFHAALPGWGDALVAFGFVSAFYGVAIGITQRNPKTVLAYSSISQMGVIAAVLGMGLAAADKGASLDVAFYAAHHVLVKAALFLTIGVAAVSSGRRLWLVLLMAAVLALSLGGLPLTGGALAKFAIKESLGNGIASTAATVSAAGTTLLMLHFLLRLARSRDASGGFRGARLVLAGGSAGLCRDPLADVSRPRRRHRRCAYHALRGASAGSDRRCACPRIVALGRPPATRTGRGHHHKGGGCPPRELRFRCRLERMDSRLRQWPAAGLSLLAVALILAAAAASSH